MPKQYLARPQDVGSLKVTTKTLHSRGLEHVEGDIIEVPPDILERHKDLTISSGDVTLLNMSHQVGLVEMITV